MSKKLYISGTVISIFAITVVIIFLINKNTTSQQYSATQGVEIIGDESETETELASTSMDKSLEENHTAKNDVEEKPLVIEQPAEIQENVKEVAVEEIQDPTFKMPVEGEIIRDYAKDELVYSDTLKEWVTHLGIDIKAEKTTVVKASSDGKVVAIKNDPRYGLTIQIEHVNGYSTNYSNLLTAEFVTVGEEVKQGDTIGTVGNTAAFEILDPTHLHFEILKDGKQIDPNMYL